MIITFDKVPATLDEFKALPEASLEKPEYAMALFILAMLNYKTDTDLAVSQINYLRGPVNPLSNADLSFIKDRMQGGDNVPKSYFKGATPDNAYTPDQPLTIEITENSYSYAEENYAVLHCKSGGADSPRQCKMRKGGDGKWYLWSQQVLVGIRDPKGFWA